MKQFPRTKAAGNLGAAFVAGVVFGAGSILRVVHEETDLGIDGYVEFVEDGRATGTLVGVQIKAGPSYLIPHKGNRQFRTVVSLKDIKYWNAQPIPVALIMHDPETASSAWLDVTGFIRDNPECLHNSTTTMMADGIARPFNAASFRTDFVRVFQGYRLEADLFHFAELMASENPGDKFQGLLGLRSHPTSRFSRLTCYLLFSHLFAADGTLRAAATDTLARYLPHPEAGFDAPRDIRDYVVRKLAHFGYQDVCGLLETAWLEEENLMERGSVGQSAGVLITQIPGFSQHLCRLVSDACESENVRLAAIALAVEFWIEPVVAHVAKNVDQMGTGTVREAAEWAAETFLTVELWETSLCGMMEELGDDDDALGDALRDATVLFLTANESLIEGLATRTSNEYVRSQAHRAINRISSFRFPPDAHMQRLL